MMRDWKKDIRDSFIILVEIIIICFLIVASNNHYAKSKTSQNQRLPGMCSAPCKYDNVFIGIPTEGDRMEAAYRWEQRQERINNYYNY